jgi:hypothetical protein
LDPECNRASFVSDVTVPDGTIITATEKFTKTWRFENTGTCTWSTDYKLVFIGGDRMGSPDGIPLPNPVLPNEEIEISIDLTAPELPGIYKGVWILEDGAGNRFGLGAQSRGEIWVQVQVIAGPTATFTTEPTQTALPSQTAEPSQTPLPTSTPLLGITESEIFAYDLVKEACSAQWSSNGQQQPCPAAGGEAQNNSVGLTSNAILENGAVISEPSIVVIPGVANSFVTAAYPSYTVQPGDHFRAIVGCESTAATCAVLFRISYQNELGVTNDLWAVGEFYDQNITTVDVDLSPLAGQNIKLILDTKSLNSSATDRTLWVSPGIYRAAPPTPTSTFTAEPTIAPTNSATPAPTATTAPSAPASQPTILDQILEFLKSLFGG